MPVTLRLPTVLAGAAGVGTTHAANGGTVGEVVEAVAARHPALGARLCDPQGRPYPFVIFTVDDEDIRLRQGFATRVADGAEILVISAVAGG